MFEKDQGQKVGKHAMRRAYLKSVEDLIRHPQILSMKQYPHHGQVDCYEHSLRVSYVAYQLGLKLRMDARSLARGGMLHDFYLYDWHIKGERKGLHGFTHAKRSLMNARQYFSLTKLEEEIIKGHMWPLNPGLPTYPETYILMLADRYCTLSESLRDMKKTLKSKLS